MSGYYALFVKVKQGLEYDLIQYLRIFLCIVQNANMKH